MSDIEKNEIEQKVESLQKVLKQDLAISEINLNDVYKSICQIEDSENKTKEQFQYEDAEKTLNSLGFQYINTDYQVEMNKIKNNFYSFIKKYDCNSEEVKKMSEDEITQIYTIAAFIYKNYIKMLQSLLFNITWTREEYKFLQHIFRSKIEFSGNEIISTIDNKSLQFGLSDLKETYLDKWEEINKNLPKTIEKFDVVIDIKSIIIMYSFLGGFKIKGFGEEYYLFTSVLKKLIDTNKLFDAYKIINTRIQTDFMTWNSSLKEMENQIKAEKK